MIKETICWTCTNAAASRCSWMKRCRPVKGWEVRRNENGLRVVACPNYVRDNRKEFNKQAKENDN